MTTDPTQPPLVGEEVHCNIYSHGFSLRHMFFIFILII